MQSDDPAATGLVNRLVPVEQVLDTALELASTIAANTPLAAIVAREVIRAAR